MRGHRYFWLSKNPAENGLAADLRSVSGDGRSSRYSTVGESLHRLRCLSVSGVREKCDEKIVWWRFGKLILRREKWATAGCLQIPLDSVRDIYYIVSMQCRVNERRESLGDFETLVLMAVLRLGGDAYGMRIHRELETTAGRRCSLGALYTTLDRLETKGYVSSHIGEPTSERGGRAKKFFQIKAIGATALKHSYAATLRMAKGIEPLLGGASW